MTIMMNDFDNHSPGAILQSVMTRTVRYVDEETHCILAEDFTQVHDQLLEYSTAATIHFFEERGYSLIADEYRDSAAPGEFTVHLRRQSSFTGVLHHV